MDNQNYKQMLIKRAYKFSFKLLQEAKELSNLLGSSILSLKGKK